MVEFGIEQSKSVEEQIILFSSALDSHINRMCALLKANPNPQTIKNLSSLLNKLIFESELYIKSSHKAITKNLLEPDSNSNLKTVSEVYEVANVNIKEVMDPKSVIVASRMLF